MRNFLRNCLALLAVLMLLPVFSSCSGKEDEPLPDGPSPQEREYKRVLLLYAVASNNLYGNCLADLDEIERGAKDIDLDSYAVLAYVVGPNGDTANLLDLVRNADGSCYFEKIKEYDRNVYSTDPRRLSQVISDMASLRKSEKYGLVLWSHGTGWSYEDTIHPDMDGSVSGPKVNRTFGMDKYEGNTDYMNIDEMAEAIPSGMFDFIWFDACYMSGIETIYQLRDKCSTFVGYPTEVWSPGMPYDQTIPLLLKEDPNLVGAADLFSEYYKSKNESYTIAVIRTDGLEDLASAARSIYGGKFAAPASTLVKYSRSPCGPFYDFEQFTLSFCEDSESESDDSEESETSSVDEAKDRFSSILGSITLYKAASDFNFMYPGYGVMREEYLIPAEHFSGINTHWFSSDSSDFPTYYQQLDWYRDAVAQPD